LTKLTESFRAGRTINPKTFLGFFGTVLGFLFVACVSSSTALAVSNTRTELIPWILGFAGLIFVVLVGGVFVVMLVNPSKVMLTQVSASEFVDIQRATTLGDSTTGKRLAIPAAETVLMLEANVNTFGDVSIDNQNPVADGGSDK